MNQAVIFEENSGILMTESTVQFHEKMLVMRAPDMRETLQFSLQLGYTF